MRADLLTPAVPVTPGQASLVELEVLNTGEVIDQIACEIPALDPAHYEQLPLGITLFPDERAHVVLMLKLPVTFPAGYHELTVLVHGRASGRTVEQRVLVEVLPVVKPALAAAPALATGRTKAAFTLSATNRGNSDLTLVLRASDLDQKLALELVPPTVTVAPGETVTAQLRARAKAKWFGAPVLHQVTVTGEQLPHVVTTDVQVRQKPRIPTGFLTALTLACIVALWALAVMFGVRAAMGTEPAKKVVPEQFATGLDPATLDPAVVGADVTGTVTAATTGVPLPRITVELFDTRGRMVAAGATKEDGTFTLAKVLPGRYTAKLRADGFPERWFPGVEAAADATPIVVTAGQPLTLDAMSLAGDAGALSGLVLAGDTTAVTVEVSVTAVDLADGADTGTVTFPVTTAVAAGSTFSVEGLPTPATYRIRMTAPGFQAQEVQQAVPGGGQVALNTVRLVAAPGTVAGVVNDTQGTALGEVTVTTKVGDQDVTTLTPTAGAVGSFSLTGLPTPGTYLVSFSKPGFGTEVVAVRLEAGQQRTDLDVRLPVATGSLGGKVTGPDGNGLGGVSVSVVGGNGQLTTSTFTSGVIGGYRLSGLPLPGTYTLTFAAPGYQSETVQVTVGKDAPEANADVQLRPVLGRIVGVVNGPGGIGVGSATITVSDGATSRTSATATTPASQVGTFEVAQLPPGTYTVTVAAAGYEDQTVLVTVSPGASVQRTVTLRVTTS